MRASAVLSTTLVGSSLIPGRRDRVGFTDVGRQRDADGLEDTTDVAGYRRSQHELLAVLLGFDRRSSFLMSEPHSGFTRARAKGSFRSLRSTSARNEQKTWPRMASSVW